MCGEKDLRYSCDEVDYCHDEYDDDGDGDDQYDEKDANCTYMSNFCEVVATHMNENENDFNCYVKRSCLSTVNENVFYFVVSPMTPHVDGRIE